MSHDVYKLFAQYDPALVDLFPFAYDQLSMPTVEEQRKAGSNKFPYLLPFKFQYSPVTFSFCKYRKVASSSPSRIEAHAGLFKLLMKRIFDPYVL